MANKHTQELSQAAEEARKKLDALSQQGPGAYQSSYGAQIDALMQQLDNRPGFQYDPNGDPLYQQYRQQYERQGKAAMADAMGNAAALTGGYGNSYAATAGNQAYQAYLSKVQDALPALYQAAYSRYQDEGEALEGQLARLQGKESAAYSAWQEQVRQHEAAKDQALDYWRYLNDAAYQAQQDELAQQHWQKEHELKQKEFNMKYAPPAPIVRRVVRTVKEKPDEKKPSSSKPRRIRPQKSTSMLRPVALGSPGKL